MTAIYVSDPIHPQVLDELAALGEIHLGYGPQAIAYTDISDRVDAVMLRTETFTADKIAASPRLRIIARHGVGSDNVDIPAATEHGVWVTVTPGQNSQAVAEHVFALALALSRKVVAAATATRAGSWSDVKAGLVGSELNGKTLGLYGLGSIGTRVARIADGFGMTVIVTDPYLSDAQVAQSGGRKVDLDELLTTADIISLHIPLTPATRHTINADAINKMRPGTLLINTARGGLIDERALIAALHSRHLGGAALDVLDAENTDMKNPLPHNQLPLDEVDTLIVTPHVAGQTDESLRNVGDAALTCIRQALAGDRPDHALNVIAVPSVA
jgi:D-3-phosphoglycerate dehydrogenase